MEEREPIVSHLSEPNPIIACCISDVHAWDTAPKARSEEKDWIKVWCSYLNQVYSIAEKNNAIVIIAGDLFDKFNPSPEVINAFLDEIISPTYAVAGNHDLEHHRQDNLHKSGYQTLESAGMIKNLSKNPIEVRSMRLHGFGCEKKVIPLKERHSLALEIAVIHEFIWTKNTGFEGAPKNARLGKWKERLEGYDIAVFGDNHTPFIARCGGCIVVNCGSLLRRNTDQVNYRPYVSLIRNDGTIKKHYLDISKDIFNETVEEIKPGRSELNMGGILEAIEEGRVRTDYVQAVEQWEKQNSKQKLVIRMLEECIR
jgi:predicted phosphodiesterase